MAGSVIRRTVRRKCWWVREIMPAMQHAAFVVQRTRGIRRVSRQVRPNVIFVSIDSMGAKHLGCYGYQRRTSPNIDRIAASGVLFENVITQSNWTKPALASILTSLYSSVHKTDAEGESGDRVNVEVRHEAHILDARFRTFTQDFKDAGYSTAAFSNGGYTHSFFGFGRGFDVYHNRAGGLKSCMYRLLRWSLNNSRPFMTWIHAWDLHFPYMDRPPYNEMFVTRREPIVVDANVRNKINRGSRELTSSEVDFLRGLYDGALNYVDYLIGTLMEELQSMDLLDHTIVIVTADHGEAFMEHGYIEHTPCLHDEVIRVPLVMIGPGLPAGQRVSSQVRSIDIGPTLLQICGLEPIAEVQGTSLLPWISGNANADLPAVSETERGGGQTAFSDGRHKIIRSQRDNRIQLYDRLTDPDEKTDVSRLCPEILVKMKSELELWQHNVAECADRYWADGSTTPLQMREEVVQRLRKLGYVE